VIAEENRVVFQARNLERALQRHAAGEFVRLKITRSLTESIDGIQLKQFEPGRVYEVGPSLGSYLLAIQAAEPVAEDDTAFLLPSSPRSPSSGAPPAARKPKK
jgi:hypothetical protein